MPKKKPVARPRKSKSGRWWELEADLVGKAVEDKIIQLWNDDADRRLDCEKNLKRFGLELIGLHRSNQIRIKDTLRFNITKSLVETITAKIGKNRPRPMVLTDGANFGLKAKAKQLQRFFDGAYQQSAIYDQAPLLFRNAMLCGTGVLGFPHDPLCQRVSVENVFPLEVLVDNVEAVKGDPRSMFRTTFEDKDTLSDRHPKHASAIESAPVWGPDGMLPLSGQAELNDIEERGHRCAAVSYAWHLPSMDHLGEQIPGRMIKVCNGVVLDDQPWTADTFPFLFLHWCAPIRGFWGAPAVTEIRGIEKEVNRIIQRTSAAMDVVGNTIIMMPAGGDVKASKMTNLPGTMVSYDATMGGTPQVFTPQPIHPAQLQQAWDLKSQAAQQLGTNELQVSATKPAGIESGRALEQLSEEHSVRFDTVSKHFETLLSVGAAHQFLRVAAAIDAGRKALDLPGFVLRSTWDKQMISIDWEKAAMQPEDFFVDVYPVSVLPHTPSGRTTEIERWQANKWIDADQAKTLLDFPDLESVASISRADFELLEWQLEQMLENGEQIAIEERQNLDRALSFGTLALLKATRELVPRAHIQCLQDFLSMCEEQILKRTPPAPPPGVPGVPGMQPQGMGPELGTGVQMDELEMGAAPPVAVDAGLF